MRRANGEGTIVHVGDKYIAKVQVGWNDNGRPRIKSFSGKSQTEALKRMRDFLKKNKAAPNADAKKTIAEGLLFWLTEFKQYDLKDSSYGRLETTIQCNILPYIGDYLSGEIDSITIQTELVNCLIREGKSYSTIKKVVLALNAYYKKMMLLGMEARNPMLGVSIPPQKKFDRKEIRALTNEEQESFVKQAVSKYANGTQRYKYGYLYIFMMFTGLRCAEMLGLTWKHIDLINNTVTVNQTLVTIKNRDVKSDKKFVTKLQKSTKTDASMRTIPLSQQAIDAISNYKTHFYTGNENDFVVTTSKGHPLRTRHFERSANYIFKAAGINASGVHILRHTFASNLFAANVDVKIISKLLGHSDVSTTYNTYVHLTSDQTYDAIQALNKIEM